MLTSVAVSLSERFKALVGEVDDLTLREVARLAGFSESYPALIASGEREIVGSDVAAKIADVFGVSLDYLLRGRGERPSSKRIQAAVAAARRKAARRTEVRSPTGTG